MRWALTISLLVAAVPAPAGIPPGFDHFYNLEYDDALHIFEEESAAEPSNADLHNHIAQTLLFREMLRVGALESEMVSRNNPFLRRPNMRPSAEVAHQFEEQLNTAMNLCQTRLAKDPRDWRALYALGVAHGLRANYEWLVRKAWYDALRDATAARRLHAKAIEVNPQFVDGYLVLGIHNYLIGSLPWQYRALGFLAGARGDRTTGINQLKIVADKGDINRYDARVFLAAIYRREHRYREAIPLVEEFAETFPRGYLFRLELALLYQDVGENDKAMAELDAVEAIKRSGSKAFASLPMAKVNYYKGTVLFWSGERERALTEFQQAVTAPGLDLNAEVMSWMRLGQIYDLIPDRSKAVQAYQKAVALAPDSDPGREAKSYLRSPYQRPATGG
jgi:tetratricopeptide (TPR) repeat protein